eukprot:6177079-Pleurochrysis_carterae.AAC.4
MATVSKSDAQLLSKCNCAPPPVLSHASRQIQHAPVFMPPVAAAQAPVAHAPTSAGPCPQPEVVRALRVLTPCAPPTSMSTSPRDERACFCLVQFL